MRLSTLAADLLILTTPLIPGYRVVKVLGIVHGMTARTRGLQSLLGGEVSAFTDELEKAKDEALTRMKQNAHRLGANGIIGVDFETTEVFQTVVLVSAHGTAVVVEKEA